MSITLEQSITPNTIDKIVLFLRESVMQQGFRRVVLGLSGGIDSAVVALLCKKAFDEEMLALCLPTKNSNPSNIEDAKKLCADFAIPFALHSIASYEEIFAKQNPSILRMGNFCARMRMILLYDAAQKHNALVIGTSNKSELMLGYSTIYGDLACAINPIAPFYKTQIFQIARLLDLPKAILEKAPSADLYPNQEDEKDLGYSYKTLDPLLFCIANNFSNLNAIDTDFLIKQGFEPQMVEAITQRIKKNLFKQSLPIFFKY